MTEEIKNPPWHIDIESVPVKPELVRNMERFFPQTTDIDLAYLYLEQVRDCMNRKNDATAFLQYDRADCREVLAWALHVTLRTLWKDGRILDVLGKSGT